MTSPVWQFPSQSSGLTDYHSIPTESALDSKLETFVREVLQNANDQGLPNGDPVEVTFEFNVLTRDDGLDTFLDVLGWDSEETSPADLRWHIEDAIENDQARDPGLKQFLSDFDEERLVVLTIHDENTTGLRGSETDNGQPYGALVKDFGGTEKPDSSSGGSHGLGKTVLWAFSGISTVLFNSVPDKLPDDGGKEPPRVVGRSILPAHEHEDESKTYTNHGWFGREDEAEVERLGRPPSLWASDASSTTETLQIGRPSERYGTSIGVVGFRVPGESLDPELDELAANFRYASAKYFWPAMVRDELKVYVATPTEGQQEVTWSDAPGVAPFVSCYEELFDVDTGELTGPGTHAQTEVELSVPREDPEAVDDPHDGYDTTVDLVVRALSPGDNDHFDETDDDDLAPNRVARLRGAQMIVDYVQMDSAAKRGTNFASVLVCGEAQTEPGAGSTDSEEAVEQFLKRSEPTQHDDWQGSDNDYLKKHYKGTIVREVNALKGSRLEGALADIVKEDIEPGNEIPGMDDVAPVMDGRVTDDNGAESALNWVTRPDVWYDGGAWHFYAEGGPDSSDHGDWTVEAELVALDGRGNESEEIEIASFEVVSGDASEFPDGSAGFDATDVAESVAFQGDSVELSADGIAPDQLFDVGMAAQTKLKVNAEVEGVDIE